MLQFLTFNKEIVEEFNFGVISGYDSFRFFAKRVGYVILCIYSTIFVAAIDPFAQSYYEIWVFFIGSIIAIMIISRLINYIFMYKQFTKGRIVINPASIQIYYKDIEKRIPVNNIKSIKVSLFGNLIFQEENDSFSFPITLLNEKDRSNIFLLFQDVSPKRTEIIKKVQDFFDALLIAFILAMHIREYIIEAFFIPTGSMEDTLLIGDHLLVEKLTYGPVIPKMIGMEKSIQLSFLGFRDIERGDIVIFKPPNEKKKNYIKRCIAIPGDELHIKDGSVFVNGKKIDEPYIKGFTNYSGFREKKIEGIVPKGMIVVFGDNRENSYDSRGFGYLSIERVKGRAFVLYWNTDHIINLDFSRFGLIR